MKKSKAKSCIASNHFCIKQTKTSAKVGGTMHTQTYFTLKEYPWQDKQEAAANDHTILRAVSFGPRGSRTTHCSLHALWYSSRDFFLPWASLVAQRIKRLPAMQETWVWSLGWGDPLEKEMATHSSILAWRIPWTEEPGKLQSMGLQRVGQGRANKWERAWRTSSHGPRNWPCMHS